MSRIGKMPITVPAGVEVNIAEGNVVTVKGPKGTLTRAFHPNMKITVEYTDSALQKITITYNTINSAVTTVYEFEK